MELNPDKTKVLSIGNYHIEFEYTLQGSIIERVSHMKDVGVTIQSNLKYTVHCNVIIRRAHFVMRNIFNTFKNQDCMFYLKLFLTYVRPVLEYASQIWSPILKENINRIENVQRYFTRRLLYNDFLTLIGLNFQR